MNRPELANIIERLEKASGPDAELDARIDCAVERRYLIQVHKDDSYTYMTEPYGPKMEMRGTLKSGEFCDSYTRSIDFAVDLVTKLLPEQDWGVDKVGGGYVAAIKENKGCHGKTAPLAILLALFRALATREPLSLRGRGMPARHKAAGMSEETVIPKKGIYIGAPACFALEEACRHLAEAFDAYTGNAGIYIVGSCLERPSWRDIDVRLIMPDDEFANLFPHAGDHWEYDARWLLLTVALSERLAKLTGLPIDFQFQPQSHANGRHNKRRNAVGLRFGKSPA